MKKSVILIILLIISMPISYAAEERIYVYGKGLVLSKEDNNVKYYHQDFLGSNNIATDAYGEIISRNVQYPYGEDFSEEGTQDGLKNNYKYTGQEQDKELYYYGARYYDPSIARFISVDPVFDSSISPYAYVNNNPMKYVDPDGKKGTLLKEALKKGPREMSRTDMIKIAVDSGLEPMKRGKREGAGFIDIRTGEIVRDVSGRPETVPKHRVIKKSTAWKILNSFDTFIRNARRIAPIIVLPFIIYDTASAESGDKVPTLVSSCLGAICSLFDAKPTAGLESDTIYNPETGELWPWYESHLENSLEENQIEDLLEEEQTNSLIVELPEILITPIDLENF